MDQSQLIKNALSAIKGLTVVYTEYPVIGAGVGAGIGVATGGGANAFSAADIVLMAAGTIASEFWFCSVTPTAVSAAETYVVDIRTSGAAHIYAFRVGVTAVTANLSRITPPYPVQVAAGLGIGARSASVGGADIIDLSICVATGL